MNRRTFFGMLGAAAVAVAGLIKCEKPIRLTNNGELRFMLNVGLDHRNGDTVRDIRDNSYWIVVDAQSDLVQWSSIQPRDHW